jgi:hypothetical protein
MRSASAFSLTSAIALMSVFDLLQFLAQDAWYLGMVLAAEKRYWMVVPQSVM